MTRGIEMVNNPWSDTIARSEGSRAAWGLSVLPGACLSAAGGPVGKNPGGNWLKSRLLRLLLCDPGPITLVA